jgi:hypothetical protein
MHQFVIPLVRDDTTIHDLFCRGSSSFRVMRVAQPLATGLFLFISPRWHQSTSFSIVCTEPELSEFEQFRKGLEARRDLMDPSELRALEQRETEQRRQNLEARTDLTPDILAARRLSDAVALQEPSELPAGPSPDLSPHDVVIACIVASQENDSLEEVARAGVDWGLRYQWRFFNGMTRANWNGDVDEFMQECHNNPSGIVNCAWFETEEETISVIAATPTRGAICKMVVHVRCRDGRPMPSRKFLWTLQQERRPPQVGCWLISSVLALDRALNELTM